MKKIFLDTEFTGLHKNSTLLSLALVAESGEDFYAEFIDYDNAQLNDWLKENVIKHLTLPEGISNNSLQTFKISGNSSAIKTAIEKWISQFGDAENIIQIWADCPAWDWVLFNDLFEYNEYNVPKLPKQIHYMPMDLAVLFNLYKNDPDISRVKFAGDEFKATTLKQHHALFDARLELFCYNKLMKGKGNG